MMTSSPHANGSPSGEGTPPSEPPAFAPASAKTRQHQIREVRRLVDNAMEDLEQVLRALRFLEKDV